MFDKLVRRPDTDVDDLDAGWTLDRAFDARRVADAAEVVVLQAALHWADLHGMLDAGVADVGRSGLPGTARLIAMGGDGTPEVDDLCVAEFAAELQLSEMTGQFLIADALDLRHRLPLVWEQCRTGSLRVWVARKIAAKTRPLTLEACARVDRQLASYASRRTTAQLLAQTDAAVIAADPALADERVDADREQQGVWLSPSTERGIKTLFARGDAADLVRLDEAVQRGADCLQILGSRERAGTRRARALGLLASPQQSLDLYASASVALQEPMPDDAPAAYVRGEAIKVDPRPRATLYVHLSADSLRALADTTTPDHPVARVEDIGPVTLDQARRWLGDSTVTVRPVIDLNNQTPVDCYETPPILREAVTLVFPTEPTPYSNSPSRGRGRTPDLDHTESFTHGSPDQTRIGNLAPLRRRRHRNKTHGGWQLKQPFRGILIWRTPHGRHYLCDSTGTRRLN